MKRTLFLMALLFAVSAQAMESKCTLSALVENGQGAGMVNCIKDGQLVDSESVIIYLTGGDSGKIEISAETSGVLSVAELEGQYQIQEGAHSLIAVNQANTLELAPSAGSIHATALMIELNSPSQNAAENTQQVTPVCYGGCNNAGPCGYAPCGTGGGGCVNPCGGGCGVRPCGGCENRPCGGCGSGCGGGPGGYDNGSGFAGPGYGNNGEYGYGNGGYYGNGNAGYYGNGGNGDYGNNAGYVGYRGNRPYVGVRGGYAGGRGGYVGGRGSYDVGGVGGRGGYAKPVPYRK